MSIAVAAQFGDNLSRIRRGADISQEDLAVMASIHRTEISMLERGIRLPRLDTLIKIAASLEVSLDELAEGLSWKPGSARLGHFDFPDPGASL